MPFDFSAFLKRLDSRARRLRAISAATTVNAVLAAAMVAAVLVIRILRLPVPVWGWALALVPPMAAGCIAYAVARAKAPPIPRLLLRLDDVLELDARLSSLFELRRRGGNTVFRRRIEQEVRDQLTDWRTALPIGRETVLGGTAGIACLGLAAVVALVPLPRMEEAPLVQVETTAASAISSASADAALLQPPPREVDPPRTVTADEARDHETSSVQPFVPPHPEATLEDVMRDLSGKPPKEAVLVSVAHDDIEDLARLQGEAMQQLAQLLEDILDRLQQTPPNEPQALTPEERERLQEQLERGGLPPNTTQDLNELMNSDPGQGVEQMVQQLAERVSDDSESGDGTPEDEDDATPQTTAVAPNPQDFEDFMDDPSIQERSDDGGIPAAVPGDGDSDRSPQGDDSSGEPSPAAGERGIEDPSPFGGTEGSAGPESDENEREAGFLREDQLGRIGPEGNFISEFVTEGVPLEAPSDGASLPAAPRVNYERIDSILRERGLPEGALDIVREYFKAITEGGS